MNTRLRGQTSTPISSRGQRSGINMSQIINQATNLRSSFKGERVKSPQEQLDKMNLGKYSVLKDFAQDQLTQISRKEYMEDYPQQRHRARTPNNQSQRGARGSSLSKYNTNTKAADERRHKQLKATYGVENEVVCIKADCPRPCFKERLCKHHFALKVKQAFRQGFKNMYRGPEQAYNVLDFAGKGYIMEGDILSSPVMGRLKYGRQDVQHCFKMLNLFNNHQQSSAIRDGVPSNGMAYNRFRETFFPQLHILQEENQSDEDREVLDTALEFSQNKEKQQEVMEKRIKDLEKHIKNKIANNYFQVRKAFLALDTDFDGYITVEDLLRYMGHNEQINYNDLKKLIMDKDPQKTGRLGYTEFSKWLGGTIHQTAGFYFRHDSQKNPQFERNEKLRKIAYPEAGMKACRAACISDLEQKFGQKVYEQWKTMRKAFMSLNYQNNGSISKEELQFYLNHWGIATTDEEFDNLYNKYDVDGDGQISYKDFQLSIGKQLQPDQGAYWRQDQETQLRVKPCKNAQCWEICQDYAVYCKVHWKIYQDKALQLMMDLNGSLGGLWFKFISTLRMNAEQDDQNQIFLDNFKKVCQLYKLRLTESQYTLLYESFPGRSEGRRQRLNVGRFYDLKVNMMQEKAYTKIDANKDDPNDDAIDAAGFTGQMNRQKKELYPISESELIVLFLRFGQDKLHEMYRMIKQIDKQRNGFITKTELDDILKELFQNELLNRDLGEIIKPYQSINNKILVDYKRFIENIVKKKDMINSNFAVKEKSGQNITPRRNNSSTTPRKNQSTTPQRHLNSSPHIASPLSPKYDKLKSSKRQMDDLSPFDPKENQQHKRLNTICHGGGGQQGHQESYIEDEKRQGGYVYLADLIKKIDSTNKTLDRPKGATGKGQFGRRSKSNAVYIPHQIAQTLDEELLNAPALVRDHPKMGRTKSVKEYHQPRLTKDRMEQLEDPVHNIESMANIDSMLSIKGNGVNRGKSMTNLKPSQNAMNTMFENRNSTLSQYLQLQSGMNNSQTPQNLHSKSGAMKDQIDVDGQRQYKHQPRVSTAMARNYDKLQLNGLIRDATPNFDRKQSAQQKFRPLVGPPSTGNYSHTGLHNSARNFDLKQVSKDNIKAKVGYEWKKIYKNLTRVDSENTGSVSKQQFSNACLTAGVNLTKDECNRIGSLYNNGENAIDFVRMSKEMGLHLSSLDYYHDQQKRLQSIKQLRQYVQDTQQDDSQNRLALRKMMQRNQQQTHNVYMQYNDNPRKSAQSPSTAASGPSIGVGQSMRLRKRNHSLTAGNSANPKNKSKTNVKKQDFLDLINKFQSKSSLNQEHSNDQVIPVTDFQECLDAVGVTLPPQELSRLIVKRPTTQFKSPQNQIQPNQFGRTTGNNNNNGFLNNFDATTGTEVKIVNGYRQRVVSTRTQSRSSSNTNAQANGQYNMHQMQPQNNRNQSKRSIRSNPVSVGGYSAIGARAGGTGGYTGVNVQEFLETYGEK